MTRSARYKWVALSNTTLGTLIAALDGSIVIISLPAIFRRIGLDPLAPAKHRRWTNPGMLTGHEFSPDLIAGPFHHGLVVVFTAATIMALLAAAASGLRGRHRPPAEPAPSYAATPAG